MFWEVVAGPAGATVAFELLKNPYMQAHSALALIAELISWFCPLQQDCSDSTSYKGSAIKALCRWWLDRCLSALLSSV